MREEESGTEAGSEAGSESGLDFSSAVTLPFAASEGGPICEITPKKHDCP